MTTELKNDLLLRTLRHENVERPPVWMMRQAGRYLPQYMKLREKYTFFERMQTPELACEITLQPIDIVGVDAAIIFSDILTIPDAMGIKVDMVPGKGPVIENPIRDAKAVMNISADGVVEKVDYVMQAISLTKKELNGRVPLIGFAGAPWTLFCYMVQGEGSKNFDKAKEFLFTQPEAADKVLTELANATIDYLNAQVDAGAQVVQLFDSWSGLLSKEDFEKWALPYISKITKAVKEVPVIVFAKGSWYSLKEIKENTNASAIGLDWTITPEFARSQLGNETVVQGNFDPSRLLGKQEDIEKSVIKMIQSFGKNNYIVNLGHGILPNVPVENAITFVETAKKYSE